MSLDDWEGFDEWQASDATLHGWSANPASLQTGRFGGQCARWASNATTTYGIKVPGVRQTIGIAWRTSNAGGACTVMDLREGGTTHGRLAYNGNGTFTVSRNGTTFGATPTTPNLGIAGNTWYYLEFDYLCDDSTGAYELKVNGVTVASGTGDSRNGGTGVLNTLVIVTPTGGVAVLDWDDMYMASGSTSFQGDCRVITAVPNSDGASAQWTPSTGTAHYAVVDEIPQNGDTDYVSSATVGHRDTYGMPALGVTGTVVGVMVQAMARKDDAGTRTLALPVRSGGTDYVDAGQPLVSTYTPIKRLLLTDPDTGSAWTVGGVNAAEVGVEVVA